MYTCHFHDADYNEIAKRKYIGSLSQVKEAVKDYAKQCKAKHWHLYHNVTLIAQH